MFWFWKHWLTPTEQRRWKLARAAKRNLCRQYLNEMIKAMFVDWRPWYAEDTECTHEGMHCTGQRTEPREWMDEFKIYPDDYRHRTVLRGLDGSGRGQLAPTRTVLGPPHVDGCCCIPAVAGFMPGSFLRMDARCMGT